MNSLLLLNKKIVLYLILFLVVFIIIFLLSKFYFSNPNLKISNDLVNIDADIVEPRFSINNKSKKISVSAKEGNFINEQEILLKKNVMFKSEDFIIKSDNVYFNTVNLTAESNNDSKFISNNYFF